jgi:quinol monooxygenase YgiN
MFGLFGKITTHPGQRDPLVDYLLKAAESLHDMEGCYVYIINIDPHDLDAIWVTEVWRSQADHQASLSDERVKAIIASARPLIAGMSDQIELTPVGGKGLPVTTDR